MSIYAVKPGPMLVKPSRRKEGNVLFNDTLNTFLFTVIWCQLLEGRKKMFYSMMHLIHFIYGYLVWTCGK